MCSENFDLLPLEILGRIFDVLNYEDLISVSSVCRRWYQTVNGYLLERKRCAILRPEITDYLPEPPIQRLSLIDFKGSQLSRVNDLVADVKRLHIGYEGFSSHSIEDDLERLLMLCDNLEELSLNNVCISNSLLKCIASNLDCTTVRSIIFECFSLDSHRALTILKTILYREIKIIVRHPGNDETNLYGRYPLPFTITDVIIPKFITTVEMDCSGLDKNCYFSFKGCNKIKVLKLINALQLNDEAIISCITRLPELECVKFSDVKDVTSAGWKSLFNCAGIVQVILNRCESGLSDSVFEDARAASCRLDLDLQNCKRVTTDGLTWAIKLSERFSVTMDYNESMLRCVENCVTFGDVPRLRCLDITIQRIHATSPLVSSQLENIITTLKYNLNQLGIQFAYKEITSVMAQTFHPPSAIRNNDD